MGSLATSTAPPSPSQLIARINAAGGVSALSPVTPEQVLRQLLLIALALDEQGVELHPETLTLLDGFDPEDDTNAIQNEE